MRLSYDIIQKISIHVPRAGYDACAQCRRASILHFYPRTPCGVRQDYPQDRTRGNQFLSTYPVRGTTDGETLMPPDDFNISIHVPRAGYDTLALPCGMNPRYFYPRTPCGVRPIEKRRWRARRNISIHVPRAGYDKSVTRKSSKRSISIHVPRAGYDRTGDFVELAGGNISIHVPRAGYD